MRALHPTTGEFYASPAQRCNTRFPNAANLHKHSTRQPRAGQHAARRVQGTSRMMAFTFDVKISPCPSVYGTNDSAEMVLAPRASVRCDGRHLYGVKRPFSTLDTGARPRPFLNQPAFYGIAARRRLSDSLRWRYRRRSQLSLRPLLQTTVV